MRRLALGLERRREFPGGAARTGLDGHLVKVLRDAREAAVARAQRVLRAAPSLLREPSRKAMWSTALAVGSQPHLSRTLWEHESAETYIGDMPVNIPVNVLSRALNLSPWEVEECREVVDRRAAEHLHQVRAARWLMSGWGDRPRDLFRALCPGATVPSGVTFRRAGAQVYGVFAAPGASAPLGLALPWRWSAGGGEAPLNGLAGRYADRSLRDALGRAVGLGDAGAIAMIDRCVVLLPNRSTNLYLAADVWRSRGGAALTGLGVPYGGDDHGDVWREIALEGWLHASDDGVIVGNAEGAFDQIALRRVAAAMRHIAAGLLGRSWSVQGMTVSRTDLDLLDVSAALRWALDPVVDWATGPTSTTRVAPFLGASLDAVDVAMQDVGRRWRRRADRWMRPPREGDGWPPVTRLMDLIVRLGAHLELLLDEPELRMPHYDLTVLFLAHQMSDAADATLVPGEVHVPGLAESLAAELWPAWGRMFSGEQLEPAVWRRRARRR